MSEKREYTLQFLQDQSGRTQSVHVTQGGKAVTPPTPEPPKPVDKSVYWTERNGKIYAYVKDPHALDDLGGSVSARATVYADYKLHSQELVNGYDHETFEDEITQQEECPPVTITNATTESSPAVLCDVADVKSRRFPDPYEYDDDNGAGTTTHVVYNRLGYRYEVSAGEESVVKE